MEADQMANEPLGIIAASPAADHPTHDDTLGFKPYVEAIASFLSSKETVPPITISIEGEWGCGKSSFLLQLEDAIRQIANVPTFPQGLPGWIGGIGCSKAGSSATGGKATVEEEVPITIRFNAWRHDKQDALWSAFALSLVESLRREVGVFRALKGDLSLFVRRLRGLGAWLQLAILLISAPLLLLVLWRLFLQVKQWRLDEVATTLKEALSETGWETSFGTWVTSAGPWAAAGVLALAGLHKSLTYIRLPLSLDLKKYISKPDYEGHIAFIENFHKDLALLIKAYAGQRRIFIFIDDLDRCDPPKAAELMQAINLMIGDTPNLVFVLGMDREKVAAGVALKYKDLFGFLPESSEWKQGAEQKDFLPLYFGYSFLEKFIQLSFSIPALKDTQRFVTLLNGVPKEPKASSWASRFWSYWAARLKRGQVNPAQGPTDDQPDPPDAAQRAYRRVGIGKDDDRIMRIVQMGGGLFGQNPRRIKQFANTFRLALYIASDQGIFDGKPGIDKPVPTPEQLGKFVALTLKFPEIRMALQNGHSDLLKDLEELAHGIGVPGWNVLDPRSIRGMHLASLNHWTEKRGMVGLLSYGSPWKDPIQSLENFDVEPFLSVLPRAPRPPEPPKGRPMGSALNHVQATFLSLDAQYNALRARCKTQAQRDAVAALYATAEQNYRSTLYATLIDNDPQVAALRAQLKAANAQVVRALAQLAEIGEVIDDIDKAVSLGTQLVAMA
jgi:hypothetical protein